MAEHQVDVLALAEHAGDRDSLLQKLREQIEDSFYTPDSETPRLHLFARHPALDLKEIYADASGRVTVRTLQFQQTEILLAVAHLVSKRNWNEQDQAAEAAILADQIRRVETARGHSRSILVGDLNMNPFEAGVIQATGLHAAMTRSTASSGTRQVQGRAYPFFYNPMWGCFGDRTPGPPDTFYYRHTGHVSFDWNIFDQVLVRPDALPWFNDRMEIVTAAGSVSLLNPNGRPDREVGSDHLPIVFRLIVGH